MEQVSRFASKQQPTSETLNQALDADQPSAAANLAHVIM
jgi:HPt (histidine-containing phosphotransfer) domain-containing protein